MPQGVAAVTLEDGEKSGGSAKTHETLDVPSGGERTPTYVFILRDPEFEKEIGIH